MVAQNNQKSKGIFYDNVVTNLTSVHMILIFIAFVVFGWISADNLGNESAYKIALMYVVLLVAALFIVFYDFLARKNKQFLFDAILWDGRTVKKNILIGLIFFIAWYLFFMQPGFAVAVPQAFASMQAGPATKIGVSVILGPMVENLLFFSALALTFMALVKWAGKDTKKAYILAGIVLISMLFFKNIPYHLFTIPASAACIILNAHMKGRWAQKLLPIGAAAFLLGANVFPAFHSFAYALVEKNFYAAVFFGFFMVIMAALVGLLAVDISHSLNNFIALA